MMDLSGFVPWFPPCKATPQRVPAKRRPQTHARPCSSSEPATFSWPFNLAGSEGQSKPPASADQASRSISSIAKADYGQNIGMNIHQSPDTFEVLNPKSVRPSTPGCSGNTKGTADFLHAQSSSQSDCHRLVDGHLYT